MTYSKDLREKTLSYLKEHSYTETSRALGISPTTILKWKKQMEETGDVSSANKRTYKGRRYPTEELQVYISSHPQATLQEIASHFGGSTSGAWDALCRIGITLKKRPQDTQNAAKKKEHPLMKH